MDQPNIASIFYGPVLFAVQEPAAQDPVAPVTLDADDIGKSITGDPSHAALQHQRRGPQALLRNLRPPLRLPARDVEVGRVSIPLFFFAAVAPTAEPQQSLPAQVKVAAVQMLGYDKTDVPRPGFDPDKAVVRYIEKAAKDEAQLVVFPEYLLGRITVPGPETDQISKAAAAARIYVIVGCWEVCEDGSFANTALLFDRAGKIVGKYHKVHAAVDHFEGEPPWSKPPSGKDTDWFVENDPEWAMKRGDEFPVFDLDFGRIGILTCYDGWFPETFRILSLKGAEVLVWVNGRRGTVEDFIVKSAMFQNEVALIATNQSYGAGTMIGQWPARIMASSSEPKETYITATINLAQVRQARTNSRNLQQRRPELYTEIRSAGRCRRPGSRRAEACRTAHARRR
jgi:predicted amidohydrolase